MFEVDYIVKQAKKYKLNLIVKKYKLNITDFDVMNELTSELSSIISQRRKEYYFPLNKK